MNSKYIDSLITKDILMNISSFTWKYVYNKQYEYYVIEYWYQSERKEILYNKQVPLFTYWLNFFDYNSYENEPRFIEMVKDFCMKGFQLIENIPVTKIDIDALCNLYRHYITIHPYFLNYFKIIQSIISLKYNDDNLVNVILKDWKILYNEFLPKYYDMQEYTYYALARSSDYNIKCKPHNIQVHLNIFISLLKKKNIYYESIFSENIDKDMSLEDCFNSIAANEKDNNAMFTKDEGIIFPKEHYYSEFYKTLDYLISQDYVLSICPNCKRRFLKKYNSKTKYCDKIFKNTHDTCQAYAAKVNYKNKLKENPIQSMYYTYRNRLYTRLRRGNISSEEANLDTLKNIRNTYLEKYKLLEDKDTIDRLCIEFKNEIHNLYQGKEL